MKSYQISIEPDTLYRTSAAPYFGYSTAQNSFEQIRPNLEVVGQTVDVQGSQLQPETAPTGMPLMFNDLIGFTVLDVVPNFMYFAAGMTPPDSIIATGIYANIVLQPTASVEIETFVAANLSVIPPQVLEANNQIITYVAAPVSLTQQISAENQAITYVAAPLS